MRDMLLCWNKISSHWFYFNFWNCIGNNSWFPFQSSSQRWHCCCCSLSVLYIASVPFQYFAHWLHSCCKIWHCSKLHGKVCYSFRVQWRLQRYCHTNPLCTAHIRQWPSRGTTSNKYILSSTYCFIISHIEISVIHYRYFHVILLSYPCRPKFWDTFWFSSADFSVILSFT